MRSTRILLFLAFCTACDDLRPPNTVRQTTFAITVPGIRAGLSSQPFSGPAPTAVNLRPQHATHGFSLPVAVIGSERPEAIPDYLAYRHFIMVTATASNASARQIAGRDAFLARVGLSKSDRASYIEAIAGVSEQLSSIWEERRLLVAGTALSSLRFAELKLLEDQVFDSAQDRLRTRLSMEGAKRLDAHIRIIKRGIVIYGEAR
jgi:hypothetical protein